MRRGAFAGWIALAAFVLGAPALGAPQAHRTPSFTVSQTVPPQVVLGLYADALETTRTPLVLTFEYSVEQAGIHNILQSHRVYRSGMLERDETISVDGETLPHAVIRIFNARVPRYTIERIAPRPHDYDFRYVGVMHDGKHVNYVFRTSAKEPGAYQVQRVIIDGLRFLPQKVDFKTARAGVVAHGSVSYGKAERFWVPVQATAVAIVGGQQSRETISWSRYGFPPSLPSSTFALPKPFVAPTVEPLLK